MGLTLPVPEDSPLGQLIRFSHWTATCIGCGLCESACPAELPLTALFRTLGERVQERLEYVPGRSLSEPPPWIGRYRELRKHGSGP